MASVLEQVTGSHGEVRNMTGTVATFVILLVLGFVGYACYVGGYRDGYHDCHMGFREASFIARRLQGKRRNRYRVKGSRYDL